MGFFSRVRRGAAVLALPLVLVACGDDSPAPSPSVSDPVTVSPSPTATGPVAPPFPEAAWSKNAAGVEAFIRYYWEVVDYAQATGDTETLKKISSDKCRPCQAGIEHIDKTHSAGGAIKMEPQRLTIRPHAFTDIEGPLMVFVDVTIRVPKGEEFYGPGDERNKPIPAARERFIAGVGWMPDRPEWTIYSLEAK